MTERTLIIAAHPDDEVLGAGGFMAKYPGCQVAILSEGTSAAQPLTNQPYEVRLASKRQATKAALARLQAISVLEGLFPDQQLSVTDRELHWAVRQILEQHQPTTVLTHHPHDLNADHRVVSEVVSVACRPFVGLLYLRRVLAFTVDAWAQPGATAPLAPQVLCGLTEEEMHAKLSAIKCYEDELRPWPHPRNLQAIRCYHRWLGAVAGCDYAEPYTLLWERV